jgi:hypothetical protein
VIFKLQQASTINDINIRVVVKIVNIQEEKNDAEKIAKNKTKKMVVIKNQSLYS